MVYEGTNLKRKSHFTVGHIGKYLAQRDNGWFCHYCGCAIHTDPDRVDTLRKPAQATVDHKTPLVKGGADNVVNMVLACEDCNTEKSDTDYEEFLIRKGQCFMPKVSDIKVQLNIDTEAFEKTAEKIEALGKSLSAVSLPLTLIGSALHRQAVDAEKQAILNGAVDEVLMALANYRTFEFKPLQPSDYPIELRWEYQKYILSTPIRVGQWVWERMREGS